MEQNHNEKVLAALADPTRRQLLDILAEAGSATASMLATKVPVSRQAVTKHLTVLHAAGVVSFRRLGREMRYTICPGQLNETAAWMTDLAARWDKRLAYIKRVAEGKDDQD